MEKNDIKKTKQKYTKPTLQSESLIIGDNFSTCTKTQLGGCKTYVDKTNPV